MDSFAVSDVITQTGILTTLMPGKWTTKSLRAWWRCQKRLLSQSRDHGDWHFFVEIHADSAVFWHGMFSWCHFLFPFPTASQTKKIGLVARGIDGDSIDIADLLQVLPYVKLLLKSLRRRQEISTAGFRSRSSSLLEASRDSSCQCYLHGMLHGYPCLFEGGTAIEK